MTSRNRVLVAGSSQGSIDRLKKLIADAPDLSIDSLVLDHRERDPLGAAESLPDLLLLHLGTDGAAHLEAVAERPAAVRPALIVVADAEHSGCMRTAMRAGARDFLMEPVSKEDLLGSIARLTAERSSLRRGRQGVITAFVNAKGGCGATFLACNVAHLFSGLSGTKTALLDLDLQSAALPRYFDLHPKRGLFDALDVAEELDATAIDAYLTKHGSGLGVLAGLQNGTMIREEPLIDRFAAVLDLLTSGVDRLIVDVPRHFDAFGALVLERAGQIVVVLQQSIPSLHDANRLYETLRRTLGIASERIIVVVNRYQKAESVGLADIEQCFDGCRLVCIPNDYRAVTESIDIGIPIYDHARRSAVTKALLTLQKELGGKTADAGGKGLFPLLRRAG